MKLVRLKPFNAKRGHHMRKYTHGPTRRTFEVDRGWYKVDDDMADYLATVRQTSSDPDSPDAFDVCTEEEAIKIDARERVEKDRRDAANPNDLPSTDLRRDLRERRAMLPADEDEDAGTPDGWKSAARRAVEDPIAPAAAPVEMTPVDERRQMRAQREKRSR